MTTEAEDKFMDRIRCNFPYHSKEKSFSLIEEAATISTNAIFAVIEEICRIPASERGNVETSFLHELLSRTVLKLDHPLKNMVVDAASKMIDEQELDVDDVINKMGIIKTYPGQYSALSILYFSCDDKEEKLDPIWSAILALWHK